MGARKKISAEKRKKTQTTVFCKVAKCSYSPRKMRLVAT